LQDVARAAGWDFPLDFASRGSATIGGAIATNAGGSRVLRFGTMRRLLAGVEAVLGSGDRVGSLVGPPKESAGFHLPSMLAGSEGTLAVITAARLDLAPRYSHAATALVAVRSVAEIAPLLGALRRDLSDLDQAELLFPDGIALVIRHRGWSAPMPLKFGAYLLVECASSRDPSPELLDCLASSRVVADMILAGTPAQRNRLRDIREGHGEAVAALGLPLKLDIAVPVTRLGEVYEKVKVTVAATSPASRLVSWGHAADGNLHINIIGSSEDWEELTDKVLRIAVEMGGTISAEHGIGVAKARWLPLVRTPAEIAILAMLKCAADPAGVLNPGVLLQGR